MLFSYRKRRKPQWKEGYIFGINFCAFYFQWVCNFCWISNAGNLPSSVIFGLNLKSILILLEFFQGISTFFQLFRCLVNGEACWIFQKIFTSNIIWIKIYLGIIMSLKDFEDVCASDGSAVGLAKNSKKLHKIPNNFFFTLKELKSQEVCF